MDINSHRRFVAAVRVNENILSRIEIWSSFLLLKITKKFGEFGYRYFLKFKNLEECHVKWPAKNEFRKYLNYFYDLESHRE